MGFLSGLGLLWSFLILIFSGIIYVLASDIYTWYYLPPGPLPLPFIGNSIFLYRSQSKLGPAFDSLAKKYGPIFSLWLGRTPYIVISDPTISSTLLASRSGKYSSRPQTIVYGEIYNASTIMPFMPYGNLWSIGRKLLHNSLKPAAIGMFKDRLEAEATKLVCEVMKKPEKWSASIVRFVSSAVFCISYGRRIDSLESNILAERLKHIAYGVDLLRPGAFLVDSFPILKYVPEFFTPFLKAVRLKGEELAEFDISLIETVKQDVKARNGNVPASLVKTMLQKKDDGEEGMELLTDRYFANIPVTIFSAGTDTTVASLHTAILALLTHPNALAEAQKEILEVVGLGRSPDFSDQAKLPYLDAIVQETLRWRPITPLSAPRMTTEDDVYEGYHIPVGSIVTALAYTMNADPSYFPQPSLFAPERMLLPSDPRYLPELQGKPFPSKWTSATFGWGRRSCLGSDLAMGELYIALAKLLWAFEIRKAEGQNYDVNAFEGAMMVAPKKFACVFKIKSEQHREVLQREMRDAETVLEKFPAFE